MSRRRSRLAFGCLATAAVSFVIVQRWMGNEASPSDQVLWSTLYSQWVWVLIAIAAAAWLPGSIPQRLGFRPGAMAAPALVLAVIGTVCLSAATSLLLVDLEIRGTGTLARIDGLVSQSRGAAPWLPLLAIGLAPGFGEEILFRGLIQRTLATRMQVPAAVILAAAFFGMVHLDPVHSPAAFVLGLYLGTVGAIAGNVWAPVLCHSVNNLVAVAGGLGVTLVSEIGTTGSAGIWAIASAIALALALWLTHRNALPPRGHPSRSD